MKEAIKAIEKRLEEIAIELKPLAKDRDFHNKDSMKVMRLVDERLSLKKGLEILKKKI